MLIRETVVGAGDTVGGRMHVLLAQVSESNPQHQTQTGKRGGMSEGTGIPTVWPVSSRAKTRSKLPARAQRLTRMVRVGQRGSNEAPHTLREGAFLRSTPFYSVLGTDQNFEMKKR